MQSMTFRHSYLYVDAIGLVEEGNKDLGAFDIVSKSIKKIKKKLREYFKAKENGSNLGCGGKFGMDGAYYTSGSVMQEVGVVRRWKVDHATVMELLVQALG